MLDRSLVVIATGLLLFFPKSTVSVQCPIVPHRAGGLTAKVDSNYSRVSCNYKKPVQVDERYKTNVKITFVVSAPLDGWEISLLFGSTSPDVSICDVNGAQVVNTKSDGTIVFRNLTERLQIGNDSKLEFNLYTAEEGVKLFPVKFGLRLPTVVTPKVNGMCRGFDIHSPSARFSVDPTDKAKYTLKLNFAVQPGQTSWITCRLMFNVPVRIIEVHHAEAVRNDKTNEVVIARNNTRNMAKKTVIKYTILRKRVKSDGYNSSLCRACYVDPTTNRYVPATDPVETPRLPTFNCGSTTTRITQTTASVKKVTSSMQTLSIGTPSSSAFSSGNTDITETPQATSDLNSKSDQSSNSYVVWIAVAAGCAGALVVLLLVASFMIMSRKSGTPETRPLQLPNLDPGRSSNEYEMSSMRPSANGNGFTNTSCCNDFSNTTNLAKLLGDDKYGPAYEELDRFLPFLESPTSDCNFDHSTGKNICDYLLPGQRLHTLTEESPRYTEGASDLRKKAVQEGMYVAMHSVDEERNGSKAFDDCDVTYKDGTAREDEVMTSEKTYVTMHSIEEKNSEHEDDTKTTSVTESVNAAVESDSPPLAMDRQDTEDEDEETELKSPDKSLDDDKTKTENACSDAMDVEKAEQDDCTKTSDDDKQPET
ncbi:uncharacterized protein LOC134192365 [Corticium candelabrum]|uniref:uncharacterized protein LOC134192365 n=1 Tax=Corticium candelabrum TaxID=121492 RepID=UPI002E27499D|nr:uncharacterized protein LOC134192365 [Corticium candelabrum]